MRSLAAPRLLACAEALLESSAIASEATLDHAEAEVSQRERCKRF